MPNVVTTMLLAVDQVIAGFLAATHGVFMAEYGGVLRLIFILAVAGYGVTVIMGRTEAPLRQAAWNIFIWSIVYVLITDLGTFAITLQELLINGPSEAAGVILSAVSPQGSAAGAYEQLGEVFNTILTITKRIFALGGWGKAILWYIWGVFYFILAMATVTLALYRIVLAKVALTAFLGLTWFVLPLYLFKGTNFMVDGWRRQVLNYAVTPLVVAVMLALTIGMIELTGINEMAAGETELGMWSIGFQMVFMAVALGLFTQIGSMTAAITGGSTLAANEVWRAMQQSANRPVAAARRFASNARSRSVTVASKFAGT